MAIEFTCNCGKRLSVPDDVAGRRAKCPSCGAVLDVPGAAPPPPSAEGESTSKVDQVVDKLSADFAESRERAPQLTQIAVALAVVAGATLVLTFFVSLSMIVVWILVWLPVSAAGGLGALGIIKAHARTPKLVQLAAPVIVGINWAMLWRAAGSPMSPGALLTLLIAAVNLAAYGFLYWYFSRHDTLLLFPEETEDAQLIEDQSQPAEGVEKS
ncbi:MAG: hypothetical protein AMK75_01070 [Planctomycetes bacterium SM23_65]|nr:MAG: hypothetical protein AMK75_01070 [Planctomycetes bacterium SM23_65]